jgi:hypothetical protein
VLPGGLGGAHSRWIGLFDAAKTEIGMIAAKKMLNTIIFLFIISLTRVDLEVKVY